MKPVLLLVPGLLNDERVWADVAPLLRDVAEVRIARVSGAASIDAMAADAWALVGDVPAATPVVPCGFSMGGYIAIAMLAKPARRAAGVALIDTSSRPEAPENVPMREKLMAAFERDFAKTVESLIPLNFHPDNLRNATLLDEFRRMAARVGAATVVRQLRAIVGRADHRDVLAALDLPALVLCANEDRMLPPALSRETAALLKGSTLVLIDGANHMTPMEQPAAVAEALRGLVAKVVA